MTDPARDPLPQHSEAAAPRAHPMDLSGRAVIVTGAAQGIGRAAARLAADLGACVTLVDLDADRLAETHESIGPERCLARVGDVSDPTLAETIVTETASRFGAVHGLVNAAGLTRPAMAAKMTEAQWRQVVDIHLTGAFHFLQATGRHMIARAEAGDPVGGSIVNIGSDAGVQGTVGQINYAAAKAGILGASMAAAREWARHGIRVNSAVFGLVETAMTETIRGDRFRETYLARIPMGRWASAEEAARPICFLLSDAASYVTGQRLSVNGGAQMNP